MRVEATDAQQIVEQGQSIGLPDASAQSGLSYPLPQQGPELSSRPRSQKGQRKPGMGIGLRLFTSLRKITSPVPGSEPDERGEGQISSYALSKDRNSRSETFPHTNHPANFPRIETTAVRRGQNGVGAFLIVLPGGECSLRAVQVGSRTGHAR